jgi:hypothetical protein
MIILMISYLADTVVPKKFRKNKQFNVIVINF